jgi:hypothetical protein
MLLSLAFLVVSTRAFADDEPPRVTRQSIESDMRGYYEGERTSAYVVMALGGASVAGGSVLVTRDSDFARGLGWPLIALGALEGLGALFYAFQVGGEIRHYSSSIDRDESGFRREEIAHMHGTTSRFVFYRLTELGLALSGVGMATYGFVANADAWKGAGIGVASIALPFLIIDTINNSRAARYTDHVNRFEPAQAPSQTNVVAPAALSAPTPFMLSYSGHF